MATRAEDLEPRGVLMAGQTFLRSAQWIERVLRPGRPRAAELTDWKNALRSAAAEPDPLVAARRARPTSLLAQRYAEHLAIVLAPPSVADRCSAAIGVDGGSSLQAVICGMAQNAGLMPWEGIPHTVAMTAWSRFSDAMGGAKAAHAAMSGFLDGLVTEPDLADTDRKVREERLEALSR